MKTASIIGRRPRQSRAGSAVLIILILLTVMVVLAAANTATVNRLRQRVKIIEERQTRRLASFSTNGPMTK
jgi:type II secretory pathway component PulK